MACFETATRWKRGDLMFLKVCNSGSNGNGYILQNDNEILVIECGCSLMDIKKMIDFQVSKIVGCIVSHEHGWATMQNT